jgi:hypothetical protein
MAMGGRVAEVRGASGHVRAAIELRDAFGTEQRQVLEQGNALHVRVEAGVWEDRSVWDRPVEQARVSVFRIIRQPDGAAIAVLDTGGGEVTYKPYPNPLTLDVDLCALDKLSADAKYYLDGIVTIGTLSDDELVDANEAVFGREDDPAGLKRVGKFLLNSVLQISDYVRSASAKVRSSKFTVQQLRK